MYDAEKSHEALTLQHPYMRRLTMSEGHSQPVQHIPVGLIPLARTADDRWPITSFERRDLPNVPQPCRQH